MGWGVGERAGAHALVCSCDTDTAEQPSAVREAAEQLDVKTLAPAHICHLIEVTADIVSFLNRVDLVGGKKKQTSIASFALACGGGGFLGHAAS